MFSGTMAFLALKENIKVIKLIGSLTCGVILYEFSQIFMMDRTFDLKDVIASILGALFSFLVTMFINKIILK